MLWYVEAFLDSAQGATHTGARRRYTSNPSKAYYLPVSVHIFYHLHTVYVTCVFIYVYIYIDIHRFY